MTAMEWLEILGWGLLALLGLAAIALSPLIFLLLVAAVRPESIQRAVRVVLSPRYRLKVIGREHLPMTGPVLLISNHVSWLDGFILAAVVPRRGRALVYAPYLGIPVIGPLAQRSGMIPVPDRGPRAQRAMLKAAYEVLDRGEVLAIFPEAQISRNGLLGPLYRGIEVMASNREHAAVVPVYLDNLWGSIFSYSGGRFFRKWPKGLRRTVVVSFGPPIERPVTAPGARRAILEAGVRAFEARPETDRERDLETIDRSLPSLEHPTLGLLAASTADFHQGIIHQIGHKEGSFGQSVPGVALRVVGEEDGTPLPPDAEGRLQALVAGHPGWQDVGRVARIDRDGFVFPSDGAEVSG
ncbi:2-acyl-glycerophospho-ethanolamine acyltransferase [Tautonia plasticadhaerens]|uniref:2-acyl-glycerophospho-ethanolamine acyltransferase n=2 Tax=Tautonia plasticadhaerens TaxID=2527974 RepID=A0A518GW78_9BACT|nr:2-acyl-glycerophospho-ethanolamine acyltransferase [Tautonia plasticadhaerens]